MWWSFQVFPGAESPPRTGNGWKNVEENKVQSANAQVSNSVIFRIKCRAQDTNGYISYIQYVID
jgi:hypothetical protein